MSPPRETSNETDYTKPPRFHPEVDFQDWRKRVAEWVATIKKAHDHGQDRRLSTRYTLLGQVFYTEALPIAQKSLVDDEISKGTIDLFTNEDPVKTVLAIVNLVAVDAPIAQVTRLINTYQAVVSCTRKKDERLSLFASRFRGLAGKHLRYCGVSPYSQTGQVLAITLLNNARLDDVVLTNAKMQLISLAQTRAEKEEKEGVNLKVPFSCLEPINTAADHLTEVCHGSKTKSVNGREMVSKSFVKDVKACCTEISDSVEAAMNAAFEKQPEVKSFQEMFKEKGTVIKLNLDDAVTVLRNITQGQASKQTFTASEVNTMVEEKFKALISNHTALYNAPPLPSGDIDEEKNGKRGKKRKQGDRNNNKSDQKSAQGNGGGGEKSTKRRLTSMIPEAQDHCLDCGAKDHKRGSKDCKSPSWATKKIRESKAKEDSNGSEPFFRKGSNQ